MAITLDGTNGVTTPDLTVDTNTIKVDATNNRVGIGTSSPTTALTLGTSHTATVQNGGSVSAPAYGIVSGAIGVNGTYVPAANTLGFVVGGAERGRFTANGLTFNGDTAAVNALDDYEEGTWTPAVSTASTTHSAVGLYTKIGNVVSIQAQIHFTQSGTVFGSVSGLPYVPAGVNYSPLTFREWYSTGITLSGSLIIGGASTSGFWNYANSSTAVNNQQYGYSLSTTYRTS